MFRINELFTIIVEYPDSLPAIQDLKVSKILHVLKTVYCYGATMTMSMFPQYVEKKVDYMDRIKERLADSYDTACT